MGVRIIQGDQPHDGAVIYCSTTMTAFGPIFEDADEAEAFLKWLDPVDARTLGDDELHNRYAEFRERPKEDEGDDED